MGDIDGMLNEIEGSEVKMPFGDLNIGMLYDVRSLEKTSTLFQGKQIEGMKANISFEGLQFFTYLPSNYIKMQPNLMAAINAAGLTAQKWTVCYYGSLGKCNIGRLHKPGQGKFFFNVH